LAARNALKRSAKPAALASRRIGMLVPGAFSSEVDTGSREENATKQKTRAPALMPSKPERL
jgi:hypothetical protein